MEKLLMRSNLVEKDLDFQINGFKVEPPCHPGSVCEKPSPLVV